MPARDTRNKIIENADRLFYERGFENTSFSDVADAVGISRGNFYHHFKSKSEILDAVVERRVADRISMLDHWEAATDDPVARVASFIRILLMNETKIRAFGCPIGSLSLELAKLDQKAFRNSVKLFDLFRQWLRSQFEALGHIERADEYAMHVLGRSQGVATLANAYPNEKYLEREVDLMIEWLHGLVPDQHRN